MEIPTVRVLETLDDFKTTPPHARPFNEAETIAHSILDALSEHRPKDVYAQIAHRRIQRECFIILALAARRRKKSSA